MTEAGILFHTLHRESKFSRLSRKFDSAPATVFVYLVWARQKGFVYSSFSGYIHKIKKAQQEMSRRQQFLLLPEEF